MAKTDEGSKDIIDVKVACSLACIGHTREVVQDRRMEKMNTKEMGEVEKWTRGEGRRRRKTREEG